MQSYRPENKKDKKAAGDAGEWVIQDKIVEIRGKIILKNRDQEVYHVSSQQQIKENEALIKRLRAEIQGKRAEWNFSSNADEHVIKEGFKTHRESRLAMHRYSVTKAIQEKYEHVFDKVGALNAAKHEKNTRICKKRDLILRLRNMKRTAKNCCETDGDQRIRVLTTSIDKMRLKYSSACFIQKTYIQILQHLERDNLGLPGRLEALEESIRDNQSELDGDLYQIQQDARKAHDGTKSVKERMEDKIIKEKRRRDKDLADVRKRFKNLNQKEEKDSRPRRKNPQKQENEEKEEASAQFWEKVREFWEIKRAMEHLREAMSVSHPDDIAACFQRQLNRQSELSQTIEDLTNRKNHWLEELGRNQKELAAISKAHHLKVVETEACATQKRLDLMNVEDGRDTARERTTGIDGLLIDVVNAIRNIHQKTATCDWIPKQLRQRQEGKHKMSFVVSSADLLKLSESEGAVKVLYACGEKLQNLIDVADKAKREQEELLTNFASDRVQKMLVATISSAPLNIRVVIADEDDIRLTEDFFGDDADKNDEYLSREAIKNDMLQLAESQPTRKKRRRPKKE